MKKDKEGDFVVVVVVGGVVDGGVKQHLAKRLFTCMHLKFSGQRRSLQESPKTWESYSVPEILNAFEPSGHASEYAASYSSENG